MNILAFTWIDYFTDSILRGPTIGSMLMCLGASLIGVLVFLQKRSLLGESLSHAAYPGVILGVLFSGLFALGEDNEGVFTAILLGSGACTALLGMLSIKFLERRCNVRSDSALCFVLSVFFGIGVTFASQMQFTYTGLYRKAQAYLYGQAATMTDLHILVYGFLAILLIVAIILFYKEFQIIAFDETYARTLGLQVKLIQGILTTLIILAIVIGIRSVGVVLMSAMLIAPAAAARQYTHKLSYMLIIAAFFGILSGYLGTFLSLELSDRFFAGEGMQKGAFPSGPMIVLVACTFSVLSLLFAPERGLALRWVRMGYFRFQCACENILKTMWRLGEEVKIHFDSIERYHSLSPLYLKFILNYLAHAGWVKKKAETYQLTPDGKFRAERIVRLHRLWEVYLVDYLGIGVERVHRSAEEMEHIITPEIEKQLILLLNNPKEDPHAQPIPPLKETP